MADTLSQIVIANKGTDKQMKEQTGLLLKLYNVQKAQLKLEQEEAKQAARDRKNAKRDRSDSAIPGVAKEKKDKKKSEGLLSKLMKGLGSIGGLLKGGGLVAGLGKFIMTALGLKAGMNFATMLIDRLLPKNGKGMMSRIMQGLFGRGKIGAKGLFPKMLDKAFAPLKNLFGKGKLGKLFGGKNLVKGGGIVAALTSGIMEFFDTKKITDALFAGGGAGAGAVGGGILGSFLGPIGTAVGAALGGFIGDQLGKILKDQLDKNPFLAKVFGKADEMFNNYLADLNALWESTKKTFGDFIYLMESIGLRIKKTYDDFIQPLFDAVGSFVKKEWTKFSDSVTVVAGYLKKTLEPILEKIGKFLKPIINPLKELATKIIKPITEAFKSLLKLLNPIAGAKSIMDLAGKIMRGAGNMIRPDGMQTGGFVGTVPNQGGNGDRFGAMLSPGSVVLNQTAAGMMQNGGMVPTMLEQGEQVFGPSNPAAGHALMMNSMIPRFQTGGVVQTDGHSHTGSGWQPKGATDYKGRPVVLSEGGAEAFAKMMQVSGGEVKGSDVSSSKRSTSYNSQVGGVSNSNHLYGNGLDVSTGSSSWNWMRQNAGQHGWHWNDYLGPEGWHWDYTGAKSKGTNPDEGNEKGIASMITSTMKGAAGAVNSLFNFGGAGTAGGELIGAFTGAFKSVFGGMFGGGGGGGGIMSMFGGGGGGGPSEPLTGDAASSAKKMNDYIVSLGYSADQAKGIVANIQRESNFDPKVRSGDDQGPGGLFQWKGSRQTAEVARLVNSGDWKGQIKYALGEDAGPRYKSETAGMSAMDASMWWAKEWERPASLSNARNKHSQFIPSYGFQNGGVANMRGSSNATTTSMVSKSQDQLAQKIAAASTPVVIPMPSGGGGSMIQQGSTDTVMPDLPSADSSVVAMEYKYRITMGASV